MSCSQVTSPGSYSPSISRIAYRSYGKCVDSIPAVSLPESPSAAGRGVTVGHVPEAPFHLCQRAVAPVRAEGRHLRSGEGLGDAVGTVGVAGVWIPVGLLGPEGVDAVVALRTHAVLDVRARVP